MPHFIGGQIQLLYMDLSYCQSLLNSHSFKAVIVKLVSICFVECDLKSDFPNSHLVHWIMRLFECLGFDKARDDRFCCC